MTAGAKSGSRERRAYVCYAKEGNAEVVHYRRFLLPGEAVPKCATHGPMRPQANNLYFGKAT
jgi:hypothetical protein